VQRVAFQPQCASLGLPQGPHQSAFGEQAGVALQMAVPLRTLQHAEPTEAGAVVHQPQRLMALQAGRPRVPDGRQGALPASLHRTQ
jgi:hypothetical protein